VRFTDFLRVSVLLFGGAATALAAAAVVGATADDDSVLVLAALGWWTLAALAGLWLGRRSAPTPGIGRVLASARTTHSLPELEPGAVMFNRLWPLAVVTIGSGAVAFLVPQVPAIAAGYATGAALTWRKQSAAVQAVEDRDGVRFYFDRSSPFGPPQLLRTPWARKIEPAPEPTESEPAALYPG
jgi:hypothetical protein